MARSAILRGITSRTMGPEAGREVSVSEQHQSRARRTHHRHRSLRVAEWLLGALVVVLPLAIGGVHPAALIASAVVGAIALGCVLWGRGQDGVPVPAIGWALIGAVSFSLITVLPLPAGVAGWLSPRTKLWAELPPDPAPNSIHLSLDAPSTWLEIARLCGVVAIMLAAAALARRPDSAHRLTKALALAGVAVAVVSGLHLAAGASQLYGLYPFRFEDWPLTTFINANHAASLALIGALAALGLAVGAEEGRERVGWGLASLLSIALCIHSKSIGGIAALLLALVLFGALTVQRKRDVSRPLFVVGVVLGLLAIVGVTLGVGGSDLLPELNDAAASKLRPWSPTLELIRDHWLTGVGRGAFVEAYPPYAPPRSLTTVTHPENVALQWLAEWGVPFALTVFAALGVTLWRVFRKRNAVEGAAAVWHDALLAAVIGVLVHDLADFGLEFAGVGVPFAVALGIIAGRSAGRWRWHRPAWVIVGASVCVAVGVAVLVLPHLPDRDLSALNQRRATLDAEGLNREFRALQRRHPADPMVVIDASNALLGRFADTSLPMPERLRSMDFALRFLTRAQELSQQDQPHLSLAWALARLGRRSQAFTELRLAYATSMTSAAIDQALTYEATAEDLASLPVALARSRAKSYDGNLSFEPSHAAAVLLDHVSSGRHQSRLARLAAHEVLQLPATEGIDHTPELFDAACRVTFSDGECSQTKQRGCSDVSEVPTIGRQLLALGAEWAKRAPSDPRAYACVASGHVLLDADADAQRVLSEAAAKFPQASSLKLFLAQWHLKHERPTEALQALEAIPGDGDAPVVAAVRSARVRALWALGKRVAARTEAESATRLYPQAAWAFELAAGMHEANGQPDLAVRELAQAEALALEGDRARLAAWRQRLEAARRAPAPVDASALVRP